MGNKLMHEQLTIYSGTPIIARHYDYEKFTFPWHVHNEFEIIQFEEDFMAHAINNYADLSHIKKLLDESERGIRFS